MDKCLCGLKGLQHYRNSFYQANANICHAKPKKSMGAIADTKQYVVLFTNEASFYNFNNKTFLEEVPKYYSELSPLDFELLVL